MCTILVSLVVLNQLSMLGNSSVTLRESGVLGRSLLLYVF